MLRLARWGSQLGLLRLLPRQLYMPNENLSDSDRRLYQEIAYRQLLSQAMLNESLCVKENAKKVNSTSIKSQMPVLLMVSNGKETGFRSGAVATLCDQFREESGKYRTGVL